MRTNIAKNQSEQGSITVIALMILVVLTLLGITITRTSTIDVRIAGNEIPFKQSFYVAEGGINREAAEVGAGNYPVMNISAFPVELANQDTHLPTHMVNGEKYDFTLDYLGFFLPPQGYSVIHFSRYDYDIDAFGIPTESNIRVASRYYKIGPKAE